MWLSSDSTEGPDAFRLFVEMPEPTPPCGNGPKTPLQAVKETNVMPTIAAVVVSWVAVVVLLHIAIDDYRRHSG
jgi:hypothetical protein